MKRLLPLLAACLFSCTACSLSPSKSSIAGPGESPSASDKGVITVLAPVGKLALSSVHYLATAKTSCAKGVSMMGIAVGSAPLDYLAKGATLDKTLVLAPGTYDTVVRELDNCGGVADTHVAVTVQPASTTFTAETTNNTTAADHFLAQNNGNASAGNVSKLDLHTLLYPGSTTQIYAELQPWFGDKRHMSVGYVSWDPAQVRSQMDNMISRGVTGVVIDWYGPADPTEKTTLAWIAAAESHPNFKVMIMIDKGAIGLSPCAGCNPQQTLIYLTNYILQHYVSSPAYAMLNDKPVITQFDLDLHFKLDWDAVKAATSPDIVWIFENPDGFTHPDTGGSWSWMNATSKQYGMDYLDHFYEAALKHPEEMSWGAAYKGFNDTLASWSLNRIVGQQCGQTWLQTFDKINHYYNSDRQLPILQLVTWNDYEEATEVETGIDNCLAVSASASKNTLQWGLKGNENTVDHYVIYFSEDGENLLTLNTAPAGVWSMDLSSYDLGQGQIFVQAVGKPLVINHMSAPVSYTP